jgi:signal transduction histidine kinase/CheY-like chemotaxis protein
LSALADASTRRSALDTFAQHIGASAVYVFVPHPDHAERLIPAPGSATTVPSSRGWRELLARCVTAGVYEASVAFPSADAVAPAVAYAYAGVTFVVVGQQQASPELATTIANVAPLIASLLQAEEQVLVTRSELALANAATERASALATALDLARQEAEHATRVKDEFLAMLGHELRNPLAPIVTALHVLKSDGSHTRIHDILERQVGHLLRLVDDLLDVSRITRGKIELRRERVDLATIVARALEMSAPLVEERRNEVIIDVPNGLRVNGDPARLAQVVSNIVTNAAKYSDKGAPIQIRGERAGANVRLVVEDQGIGIDATYLDRVFEQFVQVPQGLARSGGGLGLGLSIVRSLVELHGGTVCVSSEGAGRGSTFVVELPHDADATAAPPPADKPAPRTRPRSSSASLLVVDDNRDAAELLGDVLVSLGYKVKVAESAHHALQLLEQFTPDAALLDIGLPVIDGYQLARELRIRVPEIQLIAITGYGQANDRDRALEAGFGAHLVKPVSIGKVTDALDQLLL